MPFDGGDDLRRRVAAEAGETILLARGGRVIARLEPISAPGERELGFVAADIPDSFFFDPLPDDELDAWES